MVWQNTHHTADIKSGMISLFVKLQVTSTPVVLISHTPNGMFYGFKAKFENYHERHVHNQKQVMNWAQL